MTGGNTRTFVEKITDIDFDFKTFSSVNQIFFIDWKKVKLWIPKVGDKIFTTKIVKDTFEKFE